MRVARVLPLAWCRPKKNPSGPPSSTSKPSSAGGAGLEVYQGAGGDIAEVVQRAEADAGHIGAMFAIFDPQRHGRRVDLLHGADAEALELARCGTGASAAGDI